MEIYEYYYSVDRKIKTNMFSKYKDICSYGMNHFLVDYAKIESADASGMLILETLH